MSVLLSAENVSKFYGTRAGCRDVSFELWPGEVLAIVGESGSGKTTLLRCLSGHLPASSGKVRYTMRDGRNVALDEMSEAERRLLMRTDWSQRTDPEAYQNFDETGQHTPGPSTEAVRFLVDQRDVLGFGSEAIGTDAGQGYHLRPPYPCHYYMHGAGRYGLQCLANLDRLPPTGAVILSPPLKIQKGSGSPLRVLALVEHAA